MSALTWTKASNGDWTDGSNWSGNGGSAPGSGDTVAISVPGTYTVNLEAGAAQSAGAVTLSASGATLSLGSTLSANTLLLTAGTLAFAGGTLQGAIVQAGGGAVAGAGTLDGVTWDGPLAFGAGTAASTSPSTLTITDGLTLAGKVGGTPGTLAVGGAGALWFQGTQTLDNAAVSLAGTIGTEDALYGATSATTLTLGSALALQQSGAFAQFAVNSTGYGSSLADSVVNRGTITAGVAGGQFLVEGTGSFTNAGQIAVSNGDAFTLASGSFANAGAITVGSGGTLTLGGPVQGSVSTGPSGAAVNTGTITLSNATLVLGSGFSNQGTVSLSGGTLNLAGLGTIAQISTLRLSGTQIEVSGTLDNTGSTLPLSASGALGSIYLTGTIKGGTLTGAGDGLLYGAGATFDGVTYRGTLDLSRPFASLTIADGLALYGGPGATAGTVKLTGAGSALLFAGSQTFDNATVLIGNAGTAYGAYSIAAPVLGASASYGGSVADTSVRTLTLGSRVTVQQQGLVAQLGTTGGYQTAFVNGGSITAAIAKGAMTIAGTSFANGGKFTVGGGETVTVEAPAFTNASGGLLGILAGSTVALSLFDYYSNPLSAGASFSNAGRVQLSGGTLTEITGSGVLPAVPVANLAGGAIFGYGTLDAALTNAGTVEASSGLLKLTQAVASSGAATGLLKIDAGATLELAGTVASQQTVSFAGAGTLKLDAAKSFAGSIAGFGTGDTIDIAGAAYTSASFVGGSLSLAGAGGSRLTLALSSGSATAGRLATASDGAGGTRITLTGAGTGPVTAGGAPVLVAGGTAGAGLSGTAAGLDGTTVENFVTGDTLDLTDVGYLHSVLHANLAGGAATISVSDGRHAATMTLPGSYAVAGFHLAADGHGGTLLAYSGAAAHGG